VKHKNYGDLQTTLEAKRHLQISKSLSDSPVTCVVTAEQISLVSGVGTGCS